MSNKKIDPYNPFREFLMKNSRILTDPRNIRSIHNSHKLEETVIDKFLLEFLKSVGDIYSKNLTNYYVLKGLLKKAVYEEKRIIRLILNSQLQGIINPFFYFYFDEELSEELTIELKYRLIKNHLKLLHYEIAKYYMASLLSERILFSSLRGLFYRRNIEYFTIFDSSFPILAKYKIISALENLQFSINTDRRRIKIISMTYIPKLVMFMAIHYQYFYSKLGGKKWCRRTNILFLSMVH